MTETLTQAPLFITMHERDNVAIVANDGGLPAGTVFPSGLTLVDKVPQAHKVALVPVIKVATRSDLARRWHDLMDVNAGRIADRQHDHRRDRLGAVPADPRCRERPRQTLVGPLGHPQRSHTV